MKYVEKSGKKYFVIVELNETVNDEISWTVHARSKAEYEKINHLNLFAIRRVLDKMGLTNATELIFTQIAYDEKYPCVLHASTLVTDEIDIDEVTRRLDQSVFVKYLEKNHD